MAKKLLYLTPGYEGYGTHDIITGLLAKKEEGYTHVSEEQLGIGKGSTKWAIDTYIKGVKENWQDPDLGSDDPLYEDLD